MYMVITQADKNIVNQSAKDISVTVELLNSDFKVVDYIEGKLISDSFSIDANSAIRRTYSMELLVTDSSMLIGYDKRIWMDKYIRPYIGIKENRTFNVLKYPKGIFTMLDSNYSYDATTNILSLSCSDLMSELNGERNGALKSAIKIEEGEKVRDVIVKLLSETVVRKFVISDMDKLKTPYEMEFDESKTYYDVLNEIVSLFSHFEMFFDINGTFVIQKIPHQDGENIMLDSSFLTPLVISEAYNTSFKDVYNRIVVWGQSIEPDYSTDRCTYDAVTNTYTATIDTDGELNNFGKYAIFMQQTNKENPKLNLNGITLPITYDNGDNLKANILNDGYNVFKYRKADNNFYLLGSYQVYAEANQTNILSPFHASKIGEITRVLTGGDYEKIYSNSLAQDRADYELYHACRLQETTNVNMIDIPWLDVNWLVEYQSYTTKDTNKYVIKQITGSTTGGTIDVSMVLFYDTDPYS